MTKRNPILITKYLYIYTILLIDKFSIIEREKIINLISPHGCQRYVGRFLFPGRVPVVYTVPVANHISPLFLGISCKAALLSSFSFTTTRLVQFVKLAEIIHRNMYLEFVYN